MNCSAGTFTSIPGQTACAACEPGLATTAQGASTCTLCSAGTYASGRGLTSCSHCPNGTLWAAAGQPCAAAGPLLTCPSGDLVQPAYNGPADLVWTIAPVGARAVQLSLSALGAGPGDALALYACGDPYCTASAPLGTVTGGGGGGPTRWVAGAPALRLHWVAMAAGRAYGGWRASWVSLEGTPDG